MNELLGTIEYIEITKETLSDYEDLILPAICEELSAQEHMNEEYMCVAACTDGLPVAVGIMDFEDAGDLNLLSVRTDLRFRNMGLASALLHKMIEVACNLYDWEENQFGDDVVLKTMYCLAQEYREPFEAWLRKNDFTDFAVLKAPEGDLPEVCAATAEIHFYRCEKENTR